MKNFLLKTLAFIFFFVTFYIIALPVWSSIMPPFMAKNVRSCVGCYGHLYSRVRDAETIKNPDILILGSSHAYRGIDPRIFEKHGFTAFNLGSSAQSPINTNLLLNQYIDKINPKMVVYEVYAGTFTIDGVEASLDMISNNPVDTNTMKMAAHTNKLTTYNTLIFATFRQLFRIGKHFKEKQYQNGDTYIPGTGYVQTEFRKNELKNEKVQAWNINPTQWEYLIQNIEILKKRKIPYLLIQTPITNKLYQSRTNNKEIDKNLSQLGNYKNFQGSLELNDSTDFYDSNHMNQIAVEKFTPILINYIKNYKNTTTPRP